MDVSAAKSFVVVDIQPTPIVQMVVGSVTDMPIRSKSIDTILCFNLLEHVFDYESALSEMHRVMKPGAVLYGWVPFIIGVHGDPNDYWRYTPETLRALLSNAGFSTIATVNQQRKRITSGVRSAAPIYQILVHWQDHPGYVCLAGVGSLLATSAQVKRRGAHHYRELPSRNMVRGQAGVKGFDPRDDI